MRYEIFIKGVVVGATNNKSAAIVLAQEIVAEQGLVDDGAYCGDDGWPAIVASDGCRVDY